MNEGKFLKVAKEAALEAGKVILKFSRQVGKLTLKHNDVSDFATKADVEAERAIVGILSKNSPDHNIIAEEGTNINKNSDYTWAIDPIDGTISYACGVPSFTISIGLLKIDKPILGVIYHIASDNLYFAEIGKGAFLNNGRIKVNHKDGLGRAVVSLDFGHKNQRQEKFKTYILPLMNKVGYIYNLGSGALSLAYTASGVLEAHIQTGEPWDSLGGTVIVREAGGKVTDFEGNEPDWNKERLSIVASNGLIHDQILEALNSK